MTKRSLTSTIDDNRRGVNAAAVKGKNINLTCDYEFGGLDGLRTKHKGNNSGLKKNVKTLSIKFSNRVFRSKTLRITCQSTNIQLFHTIELKSVNLVMPTCENSTRRQSIDM